MTSYQQGFFDAPNLFDDGKHRIAYLDWGSPDANNTIICVHGLTRNAHDFDTIARELVARGNRVMALDMAGRGDSDYLANVGQYSYPAYMADCMAFMDNFHLRGVDWIGTSMGGIIGMMIAAMHPKRIKRLVLNDIGSLVPASGLKAILKYISETPMQYATRAEAEAQLRQNLATFGIEEDAHWQHLFAYSIKEKDGHFEPAFDAHILDPIRAETNDCAEIDDINLGELWEAVQIPSLILRGELSTLLLPETVQAMCASNPKAQSVEIPNVGHAPMLLKPSEYNKIINFLHGSALTPVKMRAG